MLSLLMKVAGAAALALAVFAWASGFGNTPAYAQCIGCMGGHGGHAGHDNGSAGHQHAASDDHAGHDHDAAAAPSAPHPHHGGQLTVMPPLKFEVLYLPKEARVYLYGPDGQAETARNVQGEITLLARRSDRAVRVPLHCVAAAPGSQPDYLSAAVDLGNIKNGDLTANLRLAHLPWPTRPEATFAQSVVVSKAQPQVVLAALGPDDQAAIARQRVCPVTGARLGSMGEPIKVLIHGQPLYLCCKACLHKVQANPAAYLRNPGP